MLQQVATVDCSYSLSPEQLLEKVKGADALVIRSGTKVTREVFEASGGRLKVVGRAGVGIDNIDLAAATEYGCLVVNAPTANTVAAAEHGIALLCAMARNIAAADASTKAGKWERSKYTGVGLTGKNLVVMGFGKVGTEVARRARGLGLNVYVHDPYVTEEKARAIGVKTVDFEAGLALGDFFSLHMPLTPLTKGIFNANTFAKMKKGARIVNVARGGVVDSAALIAALDAGQVGQAALDVFEKEPPAVDDPLLRHPKIIVTPHLGASTVEAQEGVSLEIAEAVCQALRGELAATAVNAPMVPAEVLEQLKPFVQLAQGLGQSAVQLVGQSGFDRVRVVYSSPRGDDLDTRLLRAMVIKGLLEPTTDAKVNLVNADLLAKNRGYDIEEVSLRSDGRDVLTSMSVSLLGAKPRFSGAVDKSGAIYVEGCVRSGLPAITKIGNFDVDVLMEGLMLLVRHTDRPGIIAAVAQTLATAQINVSFMTVGRTARGQDAVMFIGIDDVPPAEILKAIPNIDGLHEV